MKYEKPNFDTTKVSQSEQKFKHNNTTTIKSKQFKF